MDNVNENTPTVEYRGSRRDERSRAHRDLCEGTRAALTKVMSSVTHLHAELQLLLSGMGSVEALMWLENIHDELGRIKISLLPRS